MAEYADRPEETTVMDQKKGVPSSRPSTGSSSNNMANSMLAAKNARKRAEADVQLLANRLAHLKAEEEKAKRKIEETRLRAQEIMELKKRNAEKERRRKEDMEAEKKAGSEGRSKVQLKKTDTSKQLESTKQGLQSRRRASADGARLEKQQLQMSFQELRALQTEENRRKAEATKKKREELRLSKEREEEERRKRLQQEYERRVQEEAVRRREAELLIARMEADEDAMIERLKKAQEDQRRAYADLQASLEV